MNAKPMTCDDRRLLLMLQSETNDAEQNDLMDHVEQCSHCQHRLEVLAAKPADWNKVGEALSGDSSNNEPGFDGDARSECRFSRWSEGPASWTESMAKALLSPPSHPEMLGRLGRYEVERMIGAGGMGVVFKAFDSELNRPVAMKVLAPFLSGSGSARKRFAREARAAAAIVHEHVVPIHNVETERDSPFLVMQYIAGESLQSRIDRTGPLQTCEILRIGVQIASGLSAAHQQGLVHRDIKPSNILLEQGVERALITDFGLARAVDDATLTRSGFHPGTPQFMSPEQAAGDPVDARSDLFSLGSVLYTMCTGRPPFRGETSLGVLRRIADDEPRRIREINPLIPDWLCGIIGKLMAKQPCDRYRTASEVAGLLEQCLAHVQQPEFIRLPVEASQFQTRVTTAFSEHTLFSQVRSHMFKIIFTVFVFTGLIAAYCLSQPRDSEALAELQGEWLLIASEREGKAMPADQLFNERLIIQGSQFSRPQTAPDGTEIKGEAGRLSIVPGDPKNSIDFRLWEGTAHGLYQLKDHELKLCITREGGPRPDSFQTAPGDSRVLKTYRRNQKPAIASGTAQRLPIEKVMEGESERTWEAAWMERIPRELGSSIDRNEAEKWMNRNGFQSIRSAGITLEVMQRVHPSADEHSLQRDGIRSYLYGLLQPEEPGNRDESIEVYCLFGADNKMLALNIGPQLTVSLEQHIRTLRNAHDASNRESEFRVPSPMSRPVMADEAPVIACVGPEHTVRLGDTVSHADIGAGRDPGVVRLHVWDWSRSDVSRILLVQRSELGAISPDGGTLLTLEGETIDLTTKSTRQYSGFRVPKGQRITALHISPSKKYVAAIIHVRTDVANIPTDPPTVDARHFWTLRILKLDAATNTGQRIGEYPANARAGVAFTADETAIIYSTDQHNIVRRELATGKLLRTYEPSLGVHGAVGLAVSSDGRYITAAGYHGTIHVWESDTGKLHIQQDTLLPDGERDLFFRPGVLHFSPDSSKLAMVSGNHVKILDVGTGKCIREHRDLTRPPYVHARWSADGKAITLLTSSQPCEFNVSATYGIQPQFAAGRNADRFPRIYEWVWETGEPEVKQYLATSERPAARIDPDMEMRRLTGTWRIVDRTTAGAQQKAEIGQTVQIRHGRMEEVRLDLDPNRHPKTVDIVFLEGPEKGKVLRGIYEWIPDWKINAPDNTQVPGEALRICTFTEPHPDQSDQRPLGFQAGKAVDTAIWERVSHELPKPFAQDNRPGDRQEATGTSKAVTPKEVDNIESPVLKAGSKKGENQ